MFGLSKKDREPTCPIPEQRRDWLEYAFNWLVGTFGEGPIRSRRILTLSTLSAARWKSTPQRLSCPFMKKAFMKYPQAILAIASSLQVRKKGMV